MMFNVECRSLHIEIEYIYYHSHLIMIILSLSLVIKLNEIYGKTVSHAPCMYACMYRLFPKITHINVCKAKNSIIYLSLYWLPFALDFTRLLLLLFSWLTFTYMYFNCCQGLTVSRQLMYCAFCSVLYTTLIKKREKKTIKWNDTRLYFVWVYA